MCWGSSGLGGGDGGVLSGNGVGDGQSREGVHRESGVRRWAGGDEARCESEDLVEAERDVEGSAPSAELVDGGSNPAGMASLGGEDASGCSKEGRGSEEAGSAGVRGGAHAFEDLAQSSKRLGVGVWEAIGTRLSSVLAQSGAEELDVARFVGCDLSKTSTGKAG